MNNEEIVAHMIEYVEALEKDKQASKLFRDEKTTKKDVVKSIIKELDKCTENED